MAERIRTWLAVARGHHVDTVVAIAAAAAALQLWGPRAIPLPALFSTVAVYASLVVFCALGFAVAAVQPTHEPAPLIAATSTRGWERVRLVRGLVSALLVCGLAAATAPTLAGVTVLGAGDANNAAIALDATLALTAEAMVAARLLGPGLAWSVPSAHVLAALVFGRNADGAAYPWAWFADAHSTAPELVAGAAGLLLAIAYWAATPPRRAADPTG
ncbi:MAG: hypothetical protein JWN54_1445 [Mycobacterium sp.]|nr:hypothetical protein [Mycobacterium sp.]